MSTFRKPVGPQPPGVYWRRRLMVLLGLIGVVVVIVLIVTRPETAEPSAVSSNTPSPSAEPGAAEPKNAAPGACAPGVVELVPVTDKGTYQAGEMPMLSWSATNTGAAPCRFTAGSDVQELIITSGTDRIWSSKDCQTNATPAEVELQPGVAQAIAPIPWDRTRSSAAGCDQPGEVVPAGGASYHLEVIVGEFESAQTRQFLLY